MLKKLQTKCSHCNAREILLNIVPIQHCYIEMLKTLKIVMLQH